jgi:hypothetical protein
MIDTWFKKDLEKIYKNHQIAVFIDESKEARFLLHEVKGVTIYQTYDDLEELKVKYEIEKQAEKNSRTLIYTTKTRSSLKFIREYCETNGCVEIKYLDHYIKKKVNENLNLNLNIPKEELISAAKVSVGKDKTYWMDLSHKGSSEIFDLEKELLPFLDNPKIYLIKYDISTQEIFYKKVNELIGQPFVSKPPKTLAKEVVYFLLDGLKDNNPNPTLLDVYYNWLDSVSCKASFHSYLKNYPTPNKSDIYDIHPSHPFKKIDELWLADIGQNITDKSNIQNLLPKINQRNSNKAARSIGITFWSHINVLVEFDEKNISQLSSFQECVDFYTNHFYKLDAGIRKLYAEFLTQKELIEPIQEYYKSLSTLFLDKWFKHIEDYKSNQKGKIAEILNKNTTKTAIIVGDGVSLEFSKDIISRITNRDYKLTEEYLFAGWPSETMHNMSKLYVDSGEVFQKKEDREKYLQNSNSEKEIEFIDLENVNELTDKSHYLICSYKDPDKLGETYQQKALRYFDQVAQTYADKIQQLLQNGYKQVYLVTDHGYTLTGILENSDKIEVNFKGKTYKSERFIQAELKQSIDPDLLVEKESKQDEFEYCYFAKRLGPFKTPGVYGFSHGGLSPQETIVPYLKWTNEDDSEELLQVSIVNKKELSEVTGDIFAIRLNGSSSADSLFATGRKIILLFFADGKKYNESDIITLTKDVEIKKDYQFGKHDHIEVKVLDAVSKEQLDRVSIKQSSARDLGGLL